jgi:hypothetical protein
MCRMKRFFPWLAVAATAAALGACNSNSNTVPGSCGSPSSVTQTVLVYPAPGATAVPDAFGQIVVGSTSALPTGWGLTVVNVLGQGVNGSAVQTAPTPLPTPNQTPTFANPVYQTSLMPSGTSFAGSSIAVFLNNLNSNCTPSVQIGTFTTQ